MRVKLYSYVDLSNNTLNIQYIEKTVWALVKN